jgi:hypothetical protein
MPQDNTGYFAPITTTPGARYAVNIEYKDATYDYLACAPTASATWFEYLANRFGMNFKGCAVSGLNGAPVAENWAIEGTPTGTYGATPATVSAVINQINYFAAAKGFTKTDMVTFLAGANDVKAAYEQYRISGRNSGTLATLASQLRGIGQLVGPKLTEITASGAHVVLITVPDLGLTPWGLGWAGGSQTVNSLNTDIDCSAFIRSPFAAPNDQWAISLLTDCINTGMRSGLPDGRVLRLVAADQLTRILANPASTVFANKTDPLCSKTGFAVPNCAVEIDDTDPNAPVIGPPGRDDLIPASTAGINSTYLWAGDVYLSPTGQAQLFSTIAAGINSNWGP